MLLPLLLSHKNKFHSVLYENELSYSLRLDNTVFSNTGAIRFGPDDP